MAQYPYQPYAYEPEPRNAFAAWLIRLPMLLITGAILFAFVLLAMVMVHQTQFNGLIFPGVSAYGVPLGGLSRQEALDAIQKRYTYGSQAVFTFRDGAKSWQMKAADLGVKYDPQTTVDEAYGVGRNGGLVRGLLDQWSAWTAGRAVQPQIVYDQSYAARFLTSLAAQLNQPMQDATILVTGTTVKTTPSQVGRTLDIDATLGLLRQVILNMNTGAEIPLVIKEVLPELTSSEDAAAKVRAAVSSAIQLYDDSAKPTAGPWQITPDFIGGLISIQRIQDSETTAHYDVSANLTPLRTVIQNLATTLKVDPVSARFIFNTNTNQLEPIKDSVNGRSLNVDGTLKRIEDVLFKTDVRRVPLAFIEEVPPVNSRATAKDLGITQLIVSATTYFYGSSPERKTNIQVAASRFHGLVIAPGEVFSFNNYLGDVSPETGYETGLVIFGNQTIKGVGGGVCQVSSTAFQAAFFAGFPINERYAHGYRVGYYESGVATVDGVATKTGLGMDATVYGPIIDFKFTNDTPYYLLIETYFVAAQQSLTFKFYSTSTGRTVTKDGPVTANPVAHGPAIYEPTADLAPGQSRQVDYAVDGLDVRVYRTITQNGQVIRSKEEFYSHYLPWQARFQVGRQS
jgi:vancomycin resistance protein YoaR